jgi:hypothetical protein
MVTRILYVVAGHSSMTYAVGAAEADRTLAAMLCYIERPVITCDRGQVLMAITR